MQNHPARNSRFTSCCRGTIQVFEVHFLFRGPQFEIHFLFRGSWMIGTCMRGVGLEHRSADAEPSRPQLEIHFLLQGLKMRLLLQGLWMRGLWMNHPARNSRFTSCCAIQGITRFTFCCSGTIQGVMDDRNMHKRCMFHGLIYSRFRVVHGQEHRGADAEPPRPQFEVHFLL